MEYDKKQFLDLLIEYKSDESKKARRNVSLIAFIIITIWYLKLPLTELKFFGADLTKASIESIIIIALIVLVYWLALFLMAWTQDKEIQKERSIILQEQIDYIYKRQENIEEAKAEETRYWAVLYPDHPKVSAYIDAYQLQRKRTKTASITIKLIRWLEFSVPLALFAAAIYALIQMWLALKAEISICHFGLSVFVRFNVMG